MVRNQQVENTFQSAEGNEKDQEQYLAMEKKVLTISRKNLILKKCYVQQFVKTRKIIKTVMKRC